MLNRLTHFTHYTFSVRNYQSICQKSGSKVVYIYLVKASFRESPVSCVHTTSLIDQRGMTNNRCQLKTLFALCLLIRVGEKYAAKKVKLIGIWGEWNVCVKWFTLRIFGVGFKINLDLWKNLVQIPKNLSKNYWQLSLKDF
jgi:predicted membrane protein